MYTIDDLNIQLLSELKEIAEDLGVKNYKKLPKKDLIYKILDQQAVTPEADHKAKENVARVKRENVTKATPTETKEVKESSSQTAEDLLQSFNIEIEQSIASFGDPKPSSAEAPQKKGRERKSGRDEKTNKSSVDARESQENGDGEDRVEAKPKDRQDQGEQIEQREPRESKESREPRVQRDRREDQDTRGERKGRDSKDQQRDKRPKDNRTREESNEYAGKGVSVKEFDGAITNEGVLEITDGGKLTEEFSYLQGYIKG